MPVDYWDRDQWGQLVPGSCTRITGRESTPSTGYVTEDRQNFYTTEDRQNIYIPAF